ncbi:hypothetical protein BZA77DRAFT_35194 [Pyronema omphalodes]|nr:hypothetical protein BZA77DRAFT_35194 [Pyronema omphalodes]
MDRINTGWLIKKTVIVDMLWERIIFASFFAWMVWKMVCLFFDGGFFFSFFFFLFPVLVPLPFSFSLVPCSFYSFYFPFSFSDFLPD